MEAGRRGRMEEETGVFFYIKVENIWNPGNPWNKNGEFLC